MELKKLKEIRIKDLKQVLKDNKEFWKDMNTEKPQIAIKNAIKFIEENTRIKPIEIISLNK